MAKQKSTIIKEADPHRGGAETVMDEFGDTAPAFSENEPSPSADPPGGGGQPSATPAVSGTEPAAPVAGSEPATEPPIEPPPVDPNAVVEPEPPIDPNADPAAAAPAEPADPAAAPTTPVEPDSGAFTHLDDPPPAEPSDPALPVIDFNAVSERIGYEVETLEDMETLVNQLKTPEDPFVDVSPFMKQAIEYERNGGDAKQFMSALALPIDTLSDRGVLYEQYLANHPDLKDDPEYAQQKFGREYNTKYGILEDEKLDVDFANPEDYTQYLADRKFAKQEFEHESKTARGELKANQEKVMTAAPTAHQANAEKAQAQQDKYVADSTEFVNSFDGIQIPIDTEGKTLYNASLNEDSRPLFNEWVKNPPLFLQHIGIPDDGSDVDVEALNAHMALTAMMSTTGKNGFGATFASRMKERINAGTLEHELIHPAPTNTTPGTPVAAKVDELEEAIEGFTVLVADQKPGY